MHDTPQNGGVVGTLPHLPFRKVAPEAEVPFHKSIIDNFMVYQDPLEANSLQLLGHPGNSESFSMISVIIFEVKMVDEQK